MKHSPHRKPTVQSFIDDKIIPQTGEGLRFENEAHFELTRQTAAQIYQIDPDVLAHPNNHALNLRASQVLGALMGLTNSEFMQFRKHIETYGKTPSDNDRGNTYGDRIEPYKLAQEIDTLIENCRGKETQVIPSYVSTQATNTTPPNATSNQSTSTRKTTARRKRTTRPVDLGDIEPVDIIFPLNHRCERLSGMALLEYAREKHSEEEPYTFGDLLSELYYKAGGSEDKFAAAISKAKFAGGALGLTLPQFRKLTRNETKRPPLDMMNNLAARLSGKKDPRELPEEEKIQWRKFIMGTPAEVNQTMLNHCFSAPSRDNPMRVSINVEARGDAHAEELVKFFDLLMDSHGFSDWMQLASDIAKHDPDTTYQINHHMHEMKKGTTKRMPDELTKLIVEYAYPNKVLIDQRERAEEFLSGDKYLIAGTQELRDRKSARMTAIRQKRGDDWGTRAAKTGDSTERGA
ncbi:MAG: hypothetical protein ACN2B6_03005 [Rickettsiales bacterium]